MKVHANNFIEPPQEENQDQMPMTNQGSFMTFELSGELQKYYTVSD